MLSINTLPGFTGFTILLGLISLIVLAILIAFEKERQRKAKHRASTAKLLAYVSFLPMSLMLEHNARCVRWQG